MAKVFHPQIVTANDLMAGNVIFLSAHGWSDNYRDAVVADTPEFAEALLQEANRQPAKAVGPYLVNTAYDEVGVATPIHIREQIRLRENQLRAA